MNVSFYNFAKRANSTKQPAGSGTQLTCRLKDNTSMHDPVLLVNGAPNASYTYAYIGSWGKYYFVDDMVSVANGLTEYHLREDVMASNKNEIGSTSARVLFCSNPYHTDKIDNRISVYQSKEQRGSIYVDGNNDPVEVLNSTGFYILSVIGETLDGGTVGVATSYALDQSNMDKVCKWLCDASVSQSLINYFSGDLMSGIMGCMWVPFSKPTDNKTRIVIGNQNSALWSGGTINCYQFSGFETDTITAKVACFLRYPQTDFRCAEPFTTGNIFLPGIGCIELNMSDWLGSSYINITMHVEALTGNIDYLLIHDNGALIQSAKCNVSSPCPLGEITRPYVGQALTSLAGGIAGAALTGNAGAVAGGTVGSLIQVSRHAASISGNFGGRSSSLWPYISHVEWSVDTEDPNDVSGYIAVKGRPLMEVATISSCSGYVQTDRAQVSISGSTRERDEINRIMDSGFYYE